MQKLFTKKYFLTAAECNPEKEMPLTLLIDRIIEIATLHANSWGVGYADLVKQGIGWVLSRVTIEMTRYPRLNEAYTINTWIEGYNRFFSQRNMEILDGEGHPIGYVRTIWMVINFATRRGADIAQLDYMNALVLDKSCPIQPQRRLRAVQGNRHSHYTFKYCDCDVNRHVNTTRYLALLMNQFPLEKYDAQLVSRFEVSFLHETRYGETVTVNVDDTQPLDCRLSIDLGDEAHCCARMVFTPR